MNFIIFLEFAITLCIGYIFGYINGASWRAPELMSEGIKTVKKHIAGDNRIQPGIIRRPTARILDRRNRPEYEKEAEEEVKKSLDKIPELQEHRKKLRELGQL